MLKKKSRQASIQPPDVEIVSSNEPLDPPLQTSEMFPAHNLQTAESDPHSVEVEISTMNPAEPSALEGEVVHDLSPESDREKSPPHVEDAPGFDQNPSIELQKTNDHDPGLTAGPNGQPAKLDLIILALLEHGTLDKAATALGMSTVTLWRWQRKPEFERQYRQARHDAYSRSLARLQHAGSTAVSTLLQAMEDKDAPAGVRIRAAHWVLEHATRAVEVEDLDARISRLEQIMDQRMKANPPRLP